jgi:uncharacterized protein (TIGR03790 family)
MTACASIWLSRIHAGGLGSATGSAGSLNVVPSGVLARSRQGFVGQADWKRAGQPAKRASRLLCRLSRSHLSTAWVRLGVLLVLAALAPALRGAESGGAVVVVYNSLLPASKEVAYHYAARRNVPSDQIIGLDLPTEEEMSRADYRERLQHPLLQFMENEKLIVYPSPEALKPSSAKIRYAVLCYGVPLRIAEDSSLIEPGQAKVQAALRRNGAAVDSELCILPTLDPNLPLTGPLRNPCYGTTNAWWFDPTNGLLLVARLDGPSADIARQLVDKAIDAETNGLWGRAYFDLRGLTSGPYKMGDDWIAAAAEISRRYGFETVVDNQPETFSAAFPMSQIALYAGWYDWNVSGPFTRPKVEFMPGAFAYHLQSFSAQSLRTTNKAWCGPLLAAGAAATMGCVDEPFLEGTPNVELFFARWLSGFSFGEAAYDCQQTLSWQTTVIGDPLYRPFGQDPRALHEALLRRHSKLIEWSHLRVVNRSLVLGVKPVEMAGYLTAKEAPQDSAVLTEKLSDLYQMEGEDSLAIDACRRALELDPTPQQRVRLTLTLAERLVAVGKGGQALAIYEDFLQKNPDYPDQAGLNKKILELARRLHSELPGPNTTR